MLAITSDALRSEVRAMFRDKVGPRLEDRAAKRALREEITRDMATFFEGSFAKLTQETRHNLIENLAARQAASAQVVSRSVSSSDSYPQASR